VLLGSAVHSVLEKIELPGCLKEERLEARINGTALSGRPDLWYLNCITDYKITSVWSIIYEPKGRKEWHSQLNLYRYLYQQNGLETNKLQICAILRDWQQQKLRTEHRYPRTPVVTIDVPIWADDIVQTYIEGLVATHLEAVNLPDDELPFCTPDEMWAKPTQYALMHKDKKQAVALFVTSERAQARLANIPGDRGYYIVERPNKRNRCEYYCAAKAFCNQYASYKAERRSNIPPQ